MYAIYDVILTVGNLLLLLIARLPFLMPKGSKFRKFAEGHKCLLGHIADAMQQDDRQLPTIWIHAASLGEYGVARPIIKRLRGKYKIVVTFFSSTGYEALKNRHGEADFVFYLPLDSRWNATRFIDAVRPAKAIFIISEYWVNYSKVLKKRGIPTYLVSAVINRDSSLFRWYGRMQRNVLKRFTFITTLGEESGENLRAIGCRNFAVTGDPLFDNAISAAEAPYSNKIVERFAQGCGVFVAGSISDENDVKMVCDLANRHYDTRFLFVPHEISKDNIRAIKFRLAGKVLCFSECNENTDFSDIHTLIVDYVGDLAFLYRYGRWAYVGGGFTPYLHSLIEATVYGLPVAFGPEIKRKVTPQELIKLKIGEIVHDSRELDEWFRSVKRNLLELKRIEMTAMAYKERNSGATSQILQLMGEA